MKIELICCSVFNNKAGRKKRYQLCKATFSELTSKDEKRCLINKCLVQNHD
ncbi:hypothetical protein KWV16_01945 [Clostridioides difficile]|nr:hypothetical protein [Clostridioides difficile]